MTVREMVLSDYRERVSLNPNIPGELRSALKTHERVPVFVDNLCKEIAKFDRLPKKIKIDRMKLKKLVYDMTDMFCLAVKSEADNRYKSDIEKAIMRRDSEERFKLDNEGNGIVEELGVEVKDRE